MNWRIKMEKTAKMVEELTLKRKMTVAIKNKLNNRIFLNCLLAAVFIICICIIDLVYIYATQEISGILTKLFPIMFLMFTIIAFEYSYKKENARTAIVGIEIMIFSIILLYIPRMYEHLDKGFFVQFLLIPIFCLVYYIIKSVIIYINAKTHYQNNLSDVKEIVKDND